MSGVAVTEYHLAGRRNVATPRMTLAILADFHATDPFMGAAKIDGIVRQTNGLGADMILLLGDYAGHVLGGRDLSPDTVAASLAGLHAPLGVFAVFGNHDWRDDPEALRTAAPKSKWHRAFDAAGIKSLSNDVHRIWVGEVPINLAGLESQRAYRRLIPPKFWGLDDVPAVTKAIDPSIFTILMAHEPDIFPSLDDAFDLTLSGHTHGGQIAPFGRAIVAPSKYGARYAYGHFEQGARQLLVSGGLGVSGLPLRMGRPPEITMVHLS